MHKKSETGVAKKEQRIATRKAMKTTKDSAESNIGDKTYLIKNH